MASGDGVVGGDAVDAEAGEVAGFGGVVDGPGEELQVGFADLLDEFGGPVPFAREVEAVEMIVLGVLDEGGEVDGFFVFGLLGGEAIDFEPGQGFFGVLGDFAVEGDDAELFGAGFPGFELLGQDRDDFGAAFDFEEEALRALGESGEGFGESGDGFAFVVGAFPGAGVEWAEIGEGGFGDAFGDAGGAFGVGVMHDDDLLVGGEMEVEFAGVGAAFPSEAKGGEGVFGSASGEATVGDDFLGGCHWAEDHEGCG